MSAYKTIAYELHLAVVFRNNLGQRPTAWSTTLTISIEDTKSGNVAIKHHGIVAGSLVQCVIYHAESA